LGWKDATAAFALDGVICNGESHEQHMGFHFTDLEAVMNASAKVCVRMGKILVIDKCPLSDNWSVSITQTYVSSPNLCHALLAACVEANRKLKAA
jgi:hypothetical protein